MENHQTLGETIRKHVFAVAVIGGLSFLAFGAAATIVNGVAAFYNTVRSKPVPQIVDYAIVTGKDEIDSFNSTYEFVTFSDVPHLETKSGKSYSHLWIPPQEGPVQVGDCYKIEETVVNPTYTRRELTRTDLTDCLNY